MKRSILSLIVLIALALVSVVPLAAQDTPEGFPLTIVDGAGRELTFDAPPQRVVTYYNDSYGMLATLDLMPVAQSVNPEMLTDPIYFAGQGRDIPTIPWSDAPDLEAVAAAQPDLVMVYSVEEADALEGIAPAFVTYDPATLDDLYEAVQQYGLLFARQETASAAVTAFQQRLAAYTSLAPRSVTVLKLGAMDAGAFYISTIDDPICQILNMLAICEWEKATPDEFWGYETTLEGVLELDPDVILLNNWSSASREEMLAALDANPLWNELRAVQAGRVVGTPGYENPIASSLPAATKFLDTYLPLIHPDIFPAPLTDEQVAEILAGESARSYSITDVNGNILTFVAPPTRFVSVGNRDVEMLAALGIQPVGVADIGYMIEMLQDPVYYPEPFDFAVVPLDEETFEPDLEALLALNPDVVFGSEEQRTAAQGIDLNVYAFYANNGPGTWQQGIEELRKLAALTGREEQAEVVIAQFEARLAAYKALAPMDRSVMLVGAASATEFYISTEVSGRCAIIREVATCPWPDPTGGESWSYITTLEAILAFNPDVIILDNWGEWSDEDMNAALAASPLWNELTAVQEGRVTPVLGSHNYSQGVGPIGNMRWLDLYMPVIYSEVFPAPLTDVQVQEIMAGEAAANTVTYPVTITDMTGRELTFDAVPQRVICLFNRCAQELAFIGVAPVAVGAPYTYNVALDPLNFGELAETFGQIPQGENLDWEQVASYQPDLIIGDDTMIEQAAGIAPLYALSWDASVAANVENFTTDVRNYGRIFGIEAAVETRIQSVLDRVAAYTELSPNNRSVLVVFFGDSEGSVIWIPPDCGLFVSQMTICGNPGSPEWIEGSIETLLSFDPDVLIIEQYNVDDEAATLAALNADNALWNELTAVKNGDVHLVPVSRARTNTIHAVQGAVDAIMPLIYPETFPAPLTDEQVAKIVNG